jgi:DNA-binding NtrC family response regulator
VRVISATNADLPAMIRDGRFREDLYYRLNVIEIRLPSLAERPRDILPLAASFLAPGKQLSDEAAATLIRHSWPGNVRELKNVMQRAGLLSAGPSIGAGDLGLSPAGAAVATQDPEPDRASIEQALARAGGIVAQAALDLGLSRQALYRRMERLGIARP